MQPSITPMPMPALFIGHGSPMNAIEDNAWVREWKALGAALPRPKAILCISAHWVAPAVLAGGTEWPATIHDFGGFPQPLYDIEYPAPGSPWLAARVIELLDARLKARIDGGYGLDHGAWQVLLHLFPNADVPVTQLSLDLRRAGEQHFAIGRMLGSLRDQGVLVLGSGNIVHNLRRLDVGQPAPPAWAARFRDLVNASIVGGDFAALCDLPALPDAALAAPTPEHYLPLLYVLAVARPGDALRLFNDEVFSTLSMTSLAIGLSESA